MKYLLILFFWVCANTSLPARASEAKSLKVLTLNTWMLRILGKPIAKDISARARVIPAAIAETGADLVAMQETWSNHHKKTFTNELNELGYKYHYYTNRLLGMGNGLVIASKYPITKFAMSPAFHHYTRFDEVFAAKRALYAEVQISDKLKVDFFTLHTGALTYDKKSDNYNRNQKARQRKQYLKFKSWFQNTRQNAVSVIAGDFNANYLTLAQGRFLPDYADDYLEFTNQACGSNENLLNTFLAANHMNQSSVEVPTYSNKNPYVATGIFADLPSETEDFIFSCGVAAHQIRKSSVVFQNPLQKEEEIPVRLSDHFGVMTEFELNQ